MGPVPLASKPEPKRTTVRRAVQLLLQTLRETNPDDSFYTLEIHVRDGRLHFIKLATTDLVQAA